MTDEIRDDFAAESMLDLNFDDVYEFETLPDSSEAQLRVTRAEIHQKKDSDRRNLHIVFDVPDNPRIDDIHIYMGIPNADADPKTRNKMKQRIKGFYDAIGILPGNIQLASLLGATCWAILGEEEDMQYGKRNFVREFVTAA